MLKALLVKPIQQVINYVVDSDVYLRQSFNQLNGATLRVLIASPYIAVDTVFDIDSIKLHWLDQNDLNASTASTQLAVPNLVTLLQLLTAQTPTIGSYTLTGDVFLLQKIQRMMLKANPNLTQQLAPFLGNTLAYQLNTWLLQAKQHASQILHSLDYSSQEWIKEDLNLFPVRWQVDAHITKLQQLSNDIERLNAKLDLLEHKQAQQQGDSNATNIHTSNTNTSNAAT